MAQPTRVFSVQPRFVLGQVPGGWAVVDGIFRLGLEAPLYGSIERDTYLSAAWPTEPVLAGAIHTWIEKAQSIDWKVKGGKINANRYAEMFHNAEDGEGWSYFMALIAQDFLTCDKGCFTELGREGVDKLYKPVLDLTPLQRGISPERLASTFGLSPQGELAKQRMELDKIPTEGRVVGIQQIDAARMVRRGEMRKYWTYFPLSGTAIPLPDENVIQTISIPSGRDRFRKMGYSAVSRLLDAKSLMLGYLTYYRQEIGQIPPELAVVINGMTQTQVQDSLTNYKNARESKGLDTYSKVWLLGSDDPGNKVEMMIHNLMTPNKSFKWQEMVEWWVKLVALNLGEDVSEYWLMQQTGNRSLETLLDQKTRGKGVARFCHETGLRFNMDIMPFGTTFGFEIVDDEADKARADIIATKVNSLNLMAGTIMGGAGAQANAAMAAQQGGGGLYGMEEGGEEEGELYGMEGEEETDLASLGLKQMGAASPPDEEGETEASVRPPRKTYQQSTRDEPYFMEESDQGKALFAREELRQLAVEWGVIPPEFESEDVPVVIGAVLKEIASEDQVVVYRDGRCERVKPLLRNQEQRKAMEVYNTLKTMYGRN